MPGLEGDEAHVSATTRPHRASPAMFAMRRAVRQRVDKGCCWMTVKEEETAQPFGIMGFFLFHADCVNAVVIHVRAPWSHGQRTPDCMCKMQPQRQRRTQTGARRMFQLAESRRRATAKAASCELTAGGERGLLPRRRRGLKAKQGGPGRLKRAWRVLRSARGCRKSAGLGYSDSIPRTRAHERCSPRTCSRKHCGTSESNLGKQEGDCRRSAWQNRRKREENGVLTDQQNPRGTC